MQCLKCRSLDVDVIDEDTVKCNTCGYVLRVKIDDDEEDLKVLEDNKKLPKSNFKADSKWLDFRFDSRKYTTDPQWMDQVAPNLKRLEERKIKKKILVAKFKKKFIWLMLGIIILLFIVLSGIV